MSPHLHLYDPIDTLESTPPTLDVKGRFISFVHDSAEIIDTESPIWMSPAGNWCTYFDWVDKEGVHHPNNIVAYRRAEVRE